MLLRRQNQDQRRAVRVDPSTARCCLCGKLLAAMPNHDQIAIIATDEILSLLRRSEVGKQRNPSGGRRIDNEMDAVWMNGVAASCAPEASVAIYAHRQSLHRSCYYKLLEQQEDS
jgi:hypothetical protein